MPFTLSHAAAVLPAVRRDGTGRGPLVPAVLVAGSFAPDLTYYAASVRPEAMEFGTFTHSVTGVFTVDVLISWALVALWLLVREPLVALLPGPWQPRPAALLRCGAPRARVRVRPALWWYVSAVLGALTHVVWDAFTHHDRWGTGLVPVLASVVAGIPLFQWLQYGTSALAAAGIAVFSVRALRAAPDAGPVGVAVLSVRDRCWALALLGGCALGAAVVRAVRWWAYWGAVARPWELVPTVCFGAGAGLLLGVVLYAGAVRVGRSPRGCLPDPPSPASAPSGEPVSRDAVVGAGRRGRGGR
ncbi:uncharacterized protein DUF4184 [Streptomyces sp. BK022]|uniref:DUF4184 family protein n=1 Tax=Streptomyces sp. BK022 TaxID=2512123 RepID=UPI001028FFC8|nr:DUF4184 family protein [Streptomyces sp. BK022]RZU38034.1 uncharacterized protein DUF4184 [Streptomyces sp. BK022]